MIPRDQSVKRTKKKPLLGFTFLLILTCIYCASIKDVQPLKFPIKISPLGVWAQAGDALMVPVMYLVSGTFRETPQRTHNWNVQTCNTSSDSIPTQFLLPVPGKGNASARFVAGIPIFHIPIFGGWKDYVVLQPKESKGTWFVGWITEKRELQISKIPLSGRVRLLLGPQEASFFGVDKQSGELILLECIGSGRIGEGGEYAQDILL